MLLDAVATGMAKLPQTRLEKLPRMADFALWATACETAFWPEGTFWSAYCGNRDKAVEGIIDADPVAAAVRTFMSTQDRVDGNRLGASGRLAELVGERVAKSKTGPIALGRCRAVCAGRRPSCARSASTSASRRKAGHGRG